MSSASLLTSPDEAPVVEAVSVGASAGGGSPADETLTRVGLSQRAVLLALGLSGLFGYLIPIIDMKMRNTFLGATHLPPGAIAVLLVLLLGVNPLLHWVEKRPERAWHLLQAALVSGGASALLFWRGGAAGLLPWLLLAVFVVTGLALIWRRRPLARSEVLTVYISCLFSTLAPGHGAENVFVVNLIGPFYFATRENKWLEFLEPYLKPWMTPALSGQGEAAVSGWFQGSPTGSVPWGAWLVPLLVWGTVIMLMYGMMACLSVMLRKQWIEREALAFPLTRLPLELTEGLDGTRSGALTGFFQNPLMWIGFGLAVFIQLLRGLNLYFPDVPTFPLELNTSQIFTEAPWNQIGWVPVVVFPMFVGIAFLLTSEVSFSFWTFFWFIKFQLIAAYLLGFPPDSLPNALGKYGGGPGKIFTFYQQIGCYLALVAVLLWTAREHLKHIAGRALGRYRATADEADEALSYPMAFWGFWGSFGLLVSWSVAAGLSVPLALLMWTLYLVILIGLTRLISEAGILLVHHGWGILGTIGQITNAGMGHWLLAPNAVVPASMIQGALMTDLRGSIMPSFMQGFKIAHEARIKIRPLLALAVVCSVVTMALGTYMNVRLGYQQSGLALDPYYAGPGARNPADFAAALVRGVRDASWWNLGWVGFGAVLTYGLMLGRARLAWFPLHPIGFLMAQSFASNQAWTSVFLGWLAKVLIMRFGGVESYRRTIPFFLGLTLGDVVSMLFWLVIDGWQGRVGHKLMPG
jgi:hypothetical protein